MSVSQPIQDEGERVAECLFRGSSRADGQPVELVRLDGERIAIRRQGRIEIAWDRTELDAAVERFLSEIVR